MRVLTEPKIVLASHNKGKLQEIQALLAPFGIACVSAGELGLEEPVETETSFAGNARLNVLQMTPPPQRFSIFRAAWRIT